MQNLLIFIAITMAPLLFVISVFMRRSAYKKRILNAKLNKAKSEYTVHMVYWYNSAKGSLNDTYHSCWATVTAEPFLMGTTVQVPVRLKLANQQPIEAFVPAESLALIPTQINS